MDVTLLETLSRGDGTSQHDRAPRCVHRVQIVDGGLLWRWISRVRPAFEEKEGPELAATAASGFRHARKPDGHRAKPLLFWRSVLLDSAAGKESNEDEAEAADGREIWARHARKQED